MTTAHRRCWPPTRWNVGCTDGLQRPRAVTTYRHRDRDGDRVVLLAPPGEAALLTPASARELADHLQQQAIAIEAGQHARVLPFIRR